MINNKFNLMRIVLIITFLAYQIFPCTTFIIKDKKNLVFGRNFDFSTSLGHVSINKRNLIKTAFIDVPEKKISWVSKYGSLTFNQIGKELPYGGINEAGLVIELMWFSETEYPELDNRYGLRELQWIQYQLDNFTSVREIIASKGTVRISQQSSTPIHFLMCDKKGNRAVIEYINGKFTYFQGRRLPYAALANSSYRSSLRYLSKVTCKNPPSTSSSYDRFVRAAFLSKKQRYGKDIIKYSFNVLETINYDYDSQWSIVYDIKNMIVYYKTEFNQEMRIISINSIDFSCQTPALYLDIDYPTTDEFLEYNQDANRALIENVFNVVEFLQPLPSELRDMLAAYPNSIKPVK